jgi:hypothetical protein
MAFALQVWSAAAAPVTKPQIAKIRARGRSTWRLAEFLFADSDVSF